MKTIVLLIGFVILSMYFPVNTVAQAAFERAKSLVEQRDFESAQTEIVAAIKQEPKNIEVLLMAGEIYSELEKLDVAVNYLKQAYELDKDNSRVVRSYSNALSSKGNHTLAIELMRKAVKNDKNDVYNQLTLGEVLLNADSTNAAELVITKAKEMNKKIPNGFLALGNLYFKQQVYMLANDNYESALKIDPNNLVARERLATSYYKMANKETADNALANELYSRSLQEWNTIAKQDPKNARAFFEQGKIYFYASKFRESAYNLSQYYRLRPDADNAPISRWFLAQSYDKLNQFDSAEPHLVFVIEKVDTVRTKANAMLAKGYFFTKKYKQSAEVYQRITDAQIKLDANETERYGYALFLSGDSLKGANIIRDAVTMDPTKCGTMNRLADLYRRMKRYDDAILMYQFRLKNCTDSMNPRIYALIGTSYFSANKPDSAIAPLQEAIKLDSNLVFARNLLGESLNALKRTDEAKQVFVESITMIKSNPSAYKTELDGAFSTYCRILNENKSYPELKKIAASWCELNPKSDIAYFWAGAACSQLNEKELACKNYTEAIKLNPNNENAKKYKKSLGCQ